MKYILFSRLDDLRRKMKSATTENEKKIYAEAITNCINDIKYTRRKARIRLIKYMIGSIFFVVLVGLVLYFVSTLRSNDSQDGQSIGHAVSDGINN